MVLGLLVLVALVVVVGWAFRRAGRWSRTSSPTTGSSGAWVTGGWSGAGGDFGGGGGDCGGGGGGGGC